MPNLRESHLFSSADELTEANQEAGWRIEYRQLVPGPFSSEFAVQGRSKFLVMRERFHGSLEIRGESPQGMVTGIITGNPNQRASLNGEPIDAGRFFVMLPGCELDAIVVGGVEAYSFFLPESVFFEAAAQANISSLCGHRGQVLNFQVKQSDLDKLRRVLSAWTFEAWPTEDLAHQTPASNVAMSLVAMMSHAANVPKDRELCWSEMDRVLLRRAREYIEANIQHPIIMADVCRSAGVGIRTLQRLFQRELNLSPTRYILARRLAAARQKLILSDPESNEVTSIALDHGFSHLGRFAGEYRRYFGEKPSDTLKRTAAPKAYVSHFG